VIWILKQFSKNFWYEKKENLTELFDSQGNNVVSFESKFKFFNSKSILSHSFKYFNNRFRSYQFSNEILFVLVLGALSELIEILELHTIPLSENDFKIFFQKFKNEYEEKINIVSINLDFTGKISDIVIEINNPKNTHFIQQAYLRIFSSNKEKPDLIRIYGEDPWHSSEAVPMIFFELLLKRVYPISIRGYNDDIFITSDNPVVIFRHPYGFCTVYLLPIDRKHIFCLGYYIKEEHLIFTETYLNKAEIITENGNEWIRIQAETHYII